MIDWLKVKTQYILPKHLLSRAVGGLASAQAGWLTTSLIKVFIKHFDVDMSEAVLEKPEDFATFNDFFTRELKPGIRPVVVPPEQLAHPVDGTVSQAGDIRYDSVFQAKGHDYSLTALLGGRPDIAEPFKDGKFATIYLSPRDYHRIHIPCDATLTDMLYVPGELFSVNPLTTKNVPGLFARNERVVAIFETQHGKMAMVLVGATIVASIVTAWEGTVTPPVGKSVQHWTYPRDGENAVTLKRAEEMGMFKLGSTVILCFEPGMIDFNDVEAGMTTRLGEHLATFQTMAND
ncbi:archaetidylserine decarboxylase [Aestuariibacter salexigens]|uniref:archaetidylserine decarboxylase n=1 Tax=Aestuariibacter salexigens TaxID=226010 RepID=UPI0003F616D2|nr:archaetidylserine decarboxylase [Aestuariibacter salexigens]